MSELQRHIDKKLAREKFGSDYRWYMLWMGRAMEAPLSLVVGLALGVLVDRLFDVYPWGSAFGAFLGLCTAIRFAYRLVKQYRAQPDE